MVKSGQALKWFNYPENLVVLRESCKLSNLSDFQISSYTL